MVRRKLLDKKEKLIREDLLQMAEGACHMIDESVMALENRDMDKSMEVINADDDIDLLYTKIRERCIQTIALQQPVARDLRFISAAMSVAVNLERVADYSVDIAKLVPYTIYKQMVVCEIGDMAKIAKKMVKDATFSFVNTDVGMIRKIERDEDKVDELFKCVFPVLEKAVKENPELISLALNNLLAVRCLERIGDHAINIVDRTLYAISGKEEYV